MFEKAENKSKQGRKSSIRTKLLLYFLLLSLVPTILVGVISFISSQNNIQTLTVESLMDSGQLQVDSTVSWLGERLQDVQTLADTNRVKTMDPEQVKSAIDGYYKLWGIYETMFVTDLTGTSIASNTGEVLELADRQYIKDVLASGKPVISEPLVSRATGNVILVSAAPVMKDNTMVGVAGITFPTNTIADLLAQSRTGETGEAYLVTKDGTFISPSRFEEQLKAEGRIQERSPLELKIDTDATRAIAQGLDGDSQYVSYMGHRVLGAYNTLPGYNWGLINEVEESEAFAAVNVLRNSTIVIVLVVAIIVALLAILISNSIANPVKKMATAANLLAKGNINQEIDHKGSDEIGELAESFRSMIGYQKEMSATAAQIAEGDLTASVTPQSVEDVLGNAFVNMIANLRNALEQVNQNTISLTTSSTQLSQAAGQAGSATSQISTTIQQVASGAAQQSEAATRTASAVDQLTRAIDGVAKGAQEQAAAVTRMAGLTSQLSTAIEMVATNSAKASAGAVDASKAAETGATIVEATVNGMTSIRQKVNLSASKVEEMGTRSEEIGTIVAAIEDIASQTNLLALNAAIEAARAGEHGKGFAVVADEVRKLAERAGAATKEISDLIKGIQNTVGEAVVAMHESAQEVEEGVKLAGDAGTALQDILESGKTVQELAEQVTNASTEMQSLSNELITSADEVSAIVEENTAATEQMSAGSSEITQAIDNIASVSEENSASVEEVSAATEEMSAQVEEVSASADTLSQMAAELQRVVARFKLG